MNIYSLIQELLNYALKKNLIPSYEEIYSRNLLLDCFNLDEWSFPSQVNENRDLEELLEEMCQWAINTNLINNSKSEMELFDTKIMNCVIPRPKEVIETFYKDYAISPKVATYNYYNFSKATNYIRSKRIEKNLYWLSKTSYGDLEITVNLAKPEKDPKDIEREKNMPQSSYPSCLLCADNVGYRGRLNHPARQTHRVIPLTLGGEEWFLQFSPYVYYNEHSIVFCKEHRLMKIDENAFSRLLEFVEKYPHYCIGSNADLPIVGGSILSHDHYQAGNHIFPMAKASIEKEFILKEFPEINCAIVNWPISVIRLTGKNKDEILKLSTHILNKWKNYSDKDADIIAFTNEIPHNTITPIARRLGENYQIDLALRNNRTSDEHPMGIFHPHKEVHNIKKENIGLIEVMGVAILPGRLDKEMKDLEILLKNKNWKELILEDESLKKHFNWIEKITKKYTDNITLDILKHEIGKTFATVLEHSGVFKKTDSGKKYFDKFINIL